MHFIGCYSQAQKEIKRLSITKTIFTTFLKLNLFRRLKFMTCCMRMRADIIILRETIL